MATRARRFIQLLTSILLVLFPLVLSAACAPPVGQPTPPASENKETDRPPVDYPDKGNPKLDSFLNQLIAAERRGEAEAFARQRDVQLTDGKVRVEIQAVPGQLDVAANVTASFGTIEVIARVQNAIQAVVPISDLAMLAEKESIQMIREPVRAVPD